VEEHLPVCNQFNREVQELAGLLQQALGKVSSPQSASSRMPPRKFSMKSPATANACAAGAVLPRKIETAEAMI
jgi:hypothetical protein